MIHEAEIEEIFLTFRSLASADTLASDAEIQLLFPNDNYCCERR